MGSATYAGQYLSGAKFLERFKEPILSGDVLFQIQAWEADVLRDSGLVEVNLLIYKASII